MSKRTEKFYNTFSFLYPLIDFFLKPQKRILFKEVNKYPSGELLEIGVGNGSHLKLYQKHLITGVDSSSKMLEIAARNKQQQNTKLIQMNGEDLMFDNESFDYVVLSHIIAVVDNPNLLLSEVLRVLKPQGTVFILNHFTPENKLKYLDTFFSHISFIFHFNSLFKIDSIYSLKKFILIKEINFPPLSYFKLLIFTKK